MIKHYYFCEHFMCFFICYSFVIRCKMLPLCQTVYMKYIFIYFILFKTLCDYLKQTLHQFCIFKFNSDIFFLHFSKGSLLNHQYVLKFKKINALKSVGSACDEN